MRSNVGRIAERTTRLVPSPFLRWGLRLTVKLLLPLAGAAATAGLERLRGRLGHQTALNGTVVVEINRELQAIAPASGSPAEPLVALAERADLTLARVPGRPVTCLRAVPKRAGDDIRRDVALAKERLESGTG
ncbi:MAG: hypothetical protein ACJ786_16675 [Catenulispora sp.]